MSARICPDCGVTHELRRAIGGRTHCWVHVWNSDAELAVVEACLATAAQRARDERSRCLAMAVWRACDAGFALATCAQEGA